MLSKLLNKSFDPCQQSQNGKEKIKGRKKRKKEKGKLGPPRERRSICVLCHYCACVCEHTQIHTLTHICNMQF